MREEWANNRNRKPVQSFLLVFLLVTTTMTVVFSLTAPEARAQVSHLTSALAEDAAGMPYDIGPVGDGTVIWDPAEDHLVTDYTIEVGMTLDIPPLDYWLGDPSEHEITFTGTTARRMDVYGTLITNLDDPIAATKTAFLGQGGEWDGIFFHNGSSGRIYDTLIKGALDGVVFEPGSSMVSPGISWSSFENMTSYGLRMDGVTGSPSMDQVIFYDQVNPGAAPMSVKNGSLDMNVVSFMAHGPGLPSLQISNAAVNADSCSFNGFNQNGTMVVIEDGSNGTTLNDCYFLDGEAGTHFVRVDGSTVLMEDTSFDTSGGELSVHANEDIYGVPSHVIIRQPTLDGPGGMWDDTFDNSTMNVTGTSSITLQWYINVYVEDPDGNPIANAPAWVKDSLGTPSVPPSKLTDGTGWANGFLVTELIQYNDSSINFNNFNVSAENNSVLGIAEVPINMSKEVTIIIPFATVMNTLPIVTFISTPVGIQSGTVTIDYTLFDPDPDDDGNLSVDVYFKYDATGWFPATPHASSDPTTGLFSGVTYTFVWDSSNSKDMQGLYDTDVYIRIIPYDNTGMGTPGLTGNFTVDNTIPSPNTPPVVSWLPTPVGVQSGLVTIEYILSDPDPGDDGNLSIEVYFSTDNVTWFPGTMGPGGDPITGLFNNTLYQFVWDSKAPDDLPGIYCSTVYIKIIPFDLEGAGTAAQTGNFTVDNTAPSTNSPPAVSWLPTPVGVQSGLVTIEYILMDPDPSDDGNLSIEVYFSIDNSTWYPATMGPGGDPTTGLLNNTLYQFVWDSKAPDDLPGIYCTTVYLKVIPYDLAGAGTPAQTGNFTLDNMAPSFPSPPMNIMAQLSSGTMNDIELVWNASSDDGAGYNDVVGYTIYKSSTGVNGSYGFAAWIPANGSSSYVWTDIGAGDGDWNNYFYLVRANDTSNNEEQNTYKVGKFVNYLVDDWNLISIPLIQINTTIEKVFQTIIGNIIAVRGYHAGKSRPWKNWHKDKPKYMNDVLEIDHQQGYYIKMLVPDYLVVTGKVPVNTSIQLKAGWNLVGYPSLIPKTVSDALASINSMYNKVEFYNTTSDKEEPLAPDDYMQPGLGYWIHCTADCVWEVMY